MSRWSRFIPIMAVSVVLAACGQGGGDTLLAPAGPHMDGGLLVGGNATPPAPGGDNGTNSTASTTTAPSDSTSKDGGLLVGGN